MNGAAELRQHSLQQQTRRVFLGRAGRTLGSVALASLLNPGWLRAADKRWRGVIQPSHDPAKVKRVIRLTMADGTTRLDTLAEKPRLAQLHGQPTPASATAGPQLGPL